MKRGKRRGGGHHLMMDLGGEGGGGSICVCTSRTEDNIYSIEEDTIRFY